VTLGAEFYRICRTWFLTLESFAGNVIFQLITPAGIPYNFVLTAKAASDIADTSKTESARPYQAGSA
jgi:hypothetical protein